MSALLCHSDTGARYGSPSYVSTTTENVAISTPATKDDKFMHITQASKGSDKKWIHYPTTQDEERPDKRRNILTFHNMQYSRSITKLMINGGQFDDDITESREACTNENTTIPQEITVISGAPSPDAAMSAENLITVEDSRRRRQLPVLSSSLPSASPRGRSASSWPGRRFAISFLLLSLSCLAINFAPEFTLQPHSVESLSSQGTNNHRHLRRGGSRRLSKPTTKSPNASKRTATFIDSQIASSRHKRHLEPPNETLLEGQTLNDQREEHSATTNNDDDNDHDTTIVIGISNSKTFELLFGILLGIIVLVRLIFAFGSLLWFQKHETLRLAQPSVLSVLVLAGSIAIMSCYFLILRNDFFCYIRDFSILTPLTLSGCILLGRVWRIVILLTPVLHAEEASGWGTLSKIKLLQFLTTLADCYYTVSSICGKLFWPFLSCHGLVKRLICNKSSPSLASNHATNARSKVRRRRTSMTLKKQVPIQQLVWLIFAIMIPQLLLQLCILAIPALQERLLVEPVEGFDSANVVIQREICGSNQPVPWPTYTGIALCLLPYVLTGILSWNSSDDLPKVFDEARAMTRVFKFFALVVAVAAPPLLFLGASKNDPDTYVYLMTMLVCSLAIPPVWFIVYPKVWQAYIETRQERKNKIANNMSSSVELHSGVSSGEELDEEESGAISGSLASVTSSPKKNKRRRRSVKVRRLLRKKRSKKFLPQATETKDQAKTAKLALKIGKMYEEMGLHQKSIELFDEALAVWECDPNRDSKDQIGGYTLDEINAFSVTDLECICQLLIAKGRVEGTFHSNSSSGQNNAAHAWLEALEIYERAPARAKIQDRSFLFPVFSGIFVFLKGGKIQQDEKCTFEQNLGRKFVRETKLQGDPVHYTRALAMLCETKARLGKYKVALESFELLKDIYDPLEHTEGVSAAYGTDRSAQAFSQAALWHVQLGNEDTAVTACEYVLDDLVPLMDPTNTLNMAELLLPIIYIYKARGEAKRMHALFDKHVVQNFYTHHGKDGVTPCKPVFKPMLLLLDICHDPAGFKDLVDTVEWLVEEENGVMPEFLDSVYTKLCWSMHSLMAELCLRVSNRLLDINGDINDVQTLVKKGLDLSRRASKKIKNKRGAVVLPIANMQHEPVYNELKELAEAMDMMTPGDDSSFEMSIGKNSSSMGADPKNLPSSYLRVRSSKDSTGSGSGSSGRNTAFRRLSGFSQGTALSNNSSEVSLRDLVALEEDEEEAMAIPTTTGKNSDQVTCPSTTSDSQSDMDPSASTNRIGMSLLDSSPPQSPARALPATAPIAGPPPIHESESPIRALTPPPLNRDVTQKTSNHSSKGDVAVQESHISQPHVDGNVISWEPIKGDTD